jgi:hypothetical protein
VSVALDSTGHREGCGAREVGIQEGELRRVVARAPLVMLAKNSSFDR